MHICKPRDEREEKENERVVVRRNRQTKNATAGTVQRKKVSVWPCAREPKPRARGACKRERIETRRRRRERSSACL